MERMEEEPNLRMQLTRSKDDQVIRCGEEMINVQQAKHSAESDGGVHRLKPRGK